MPNFWVGLLLMLFFCVRLKLLPVVSSAGDLKSLILPSVTLAFAMSAKYTRQVRTAILEELSQRSERVENPVAECISKLFAAFAYHAGVISWFSARRYCCGGSDLFLSRYGQPGGRGHYRL